MAVPYKWINSEGRRADAGGPNRSLLPNSVVLNPGDFASPGTLGKVCRYEEGVCCGHLSNRG